MAASEEQLVAAVINRLKRQFNETEFKPGKNQYFKEKTTTLPCRNTRIVTIIMHIPTEENKHGSEFYTYNFLNQQYKDQYTLENMARLLLQLGYENDDISGCTPDQLTEMGFIPEEGTSICAITNMLQPDNYKLVMTNEKYYGPEYESGHDGQPYYGPTYRDVFLRENLTVFGKVIAHRDVKIGSQCVSNYVGD